MTNNLNAEVSKLNAQGKFVLLALDKHGLVVSPQTPWVFNTKPEAERHLAWGYEPLRREYPKCLHSLK
jgi:hypothetical protein